jgi:hypothetical protein
MPLSELHKDVYNGLKGEWVKTPWTVSAVVCLWLVIWAVYLFVYPELAHGAEVSAVKEDVKSVMVQLVDREIITTKGMECKSSSKAFFTARIQDLMRQYQKLTGTPYVLPSCGDLN